MEKAEKQFFEPLVGLGVAKRSQMLAEKIAKGTERKLVEVFIQKGLLMMLISFLLGRAVVLSDITPFALPFFAAVFMSRRDKSLYVMLALVIGAVTSSYTTVVYTAGSIVLFLAAFGGLVKSADTRLKLLPYFVFFSGMSIRLLITYTVAGGLTELDLMMAGVESGLSLILTMIFLQSMPLLSIKKRRQALKNEEIICFIILLASVMSGTIGWQVMDMSVEHILSRYLVLLFAFLGGAAIGATVGVVTGLIMSLADVTSLYQISLLAFSGLLGGLLKDGKKIGVGFGLMIGTVLISLYNQDGTALSSGLMESGAAFALFLLTPKGFILQLSRFIPGTQEYANEQQQYLRKVRDVTAGRVEQFSNLFKTLSDSFTQPGGEPKDETSEKEVDYFLSNVTEKTCQTCYKKETCWTRNFTQTYDLMKETMQESEKGELESNRQLMKEWDSHCVKPMRVIDKINQELNYYHANQKLKKQVLESRKLVADQLMGISRVMGDFAEEIKKERENHYIQEEQIYESLESLGMEINQIDIFNLEEGDVDIEISIPHCNGTGVGEKIIAPLLSDILGETIIVKKEDCAPFPAGQCQLTLGSARTFVVEPGVACAAMGGGWVSGDSYSTMEIGGGKYAAAISDGMGNGERAHIESHETIKLLQKILQSGIEERVAIKSINSILALRTTDEIFSTLDLAVIDLQDASAKFLKIGSTPSFIKRGSKVMKIEASNLPIGMIHEFEVDMVSEQLKAEDLLIMMSDGIFEGPKNIENVDFWLKRKIGELKTDDPQEIADLLLEEVIRTKEGNIDDDMTVVVAKIKRNIPKWASIPAYNKINLYRKKAQ